MGEVTPHQERIDGLIALAREFYQRGWMWGTSGNLSVKLAERPRVIAISRSGASKGSLTYADIVVLPEGERSSMPWLLAVKSGPSAETAIHQAVYEYVPEAGAVLHVHTVASTLVSLHADARASGRVGHIEVVGLEMLKGWGIGWDNDELRASVPVLANLESMEALAAEFSSLLAEAPAVPLVLAAGHGMTVWGSDLEEAKNRLEIAEFICQVALASANAG